MFQVDFDYDPTILLEVEVEVESFNPYDFDPYNTDDDDNEPDELYETERILYNGEIFLNFKMSENIGEKYWQEFLLIGAILCMYYDEDSCDCPKYSKIIAQRIMEKNGEPFKCPDGIYPCFSCPLQSPTFEILRNILICSKSTETFEDLLQACKLTYYIDKSTHKANPLLNLINSYL